jgi:hypothetical protein
MTLIEVDELISYWTEHPPLHLAMAAVLRGGSRRTRPERPDIDTAVSALGPGFAARDVGEGLPPVALEFAQLKRSAEHG